MALARVSCSEPKAYVSQMETATVYEIDRVRRVVLRALRTGGNWTKVVQRIPVRIKVEQTPGQPQQLRAGMTVNVSVDTGRPRGLPRVVGGRGSALGRSLRVSATGSQMAHCSMSQLPSGSRRKAISPPGDRTMS